MRKSHIPAMLAVSFLVLFACSGQEVNYPERTMPEGISQDREGLEWAHETFRSKCAHCHGHAGEGRSERAVFFEPPAPDFYAARYKETDPAYLFWRIAQGKTVEPFRSRGSVMPAWGPHLSDQQIWYLVAYLQKRAGKK